ncbi:phorbol-12-myristate-13-acetate-induced protein 1 isoform X2 [Castor canadensis]|uniref:Phorbol-12-myristate-13-acetate-induced protein 1 isoform X2 n=1 Tax=Castor canadensis TaxID=51338 RepID=A0AC58M8S3_CASCN
MPGRKAQLEVQCADLLRRIGDKLNPPGCAAEVLALLAEMPAMKPLKSAPPSPSAPPELEAECVQLRRIGDKVNIRQKLLNLISKLFNLIT